MRAKDLVQTKQGRWCGSYGMIQCPCHNDRDPSLSIRDGKNGNLIFNCFAGCDWRDVKRALGLWQDRDELRCQARSFDAATVTTKQKDDTEKHKAFIQKIWNETQSAEGTLVEIYLGARGLSIKIPPTLRFHPALKHYPTETIHPAMIAPITGEDDNIIGLHRTYLAGDGSGKAQVDPQRMMLGRAVGGAVQLCKPGKLLALAEGIETALSVLQVTDTPTWSALSASGLKSVPVPNYVDDIIIYADGDLVGEKATAEAANHFLNLGFTVKICRPPVGQDFNDLLLSTLNL